MQSDRVDCRKYRDNGIHTGYIYYDTEHMTKDDRSRLSLSKCFSVCFNVLYCTMMSSGPKSELSVPMK